MTTNLWRLAYQPPELFSIPGQVRSMPAYLPDDATLALNLSYVLHEPSTSRTVRRQAHQLKRFAKRRDRIVQGFNQLDDSEFRSRVVLAPLLEQELKTHGPIETLISARAGLTELLTRAHSVVQYGRQLPEPLIVDGATWGQQSNRALFGHPARIPELPEGAVITGGVVLMPDERSLMLVGSVQNDPRTVLEDLIRDFVDQWLPERRLWEQPLEAVDPSILIPAGTPGDR